MGIVRRSAFGYYDARPNGNTSAAGSRTPEVLVCIIEVDLSETC